MISHSSVVSAPGLRRMESGMPILPRSWSGAARRTSSDLLVIHSGGAGEVRGDRGHALGVAAGVVVAEFGRDRQPLQRVEVGVLQLGGPLPDPPLQHHVLGRDLAVKVLGLQQVADPKQDLVHFERLGHEVLRALGERPAAGLLGRVAGEHQDRQVAVRAWRLPPAARAPRLRPVPACEGRAAPDRAPAPRTVLRTWVGSVVATTLVYPAVFSIRLRVRTLLASLSTTRMRAVEYPWCSGFASSIRFLPTPRDPSMTRRTNGHRRSGPPPGKPLHEMPGRRASFCGAVI